ncbi:unnamed protein product, partial [Owenia fusiformis]
FGYEFNEDGELRDKESGEPFKFKVKNKHTYNQKRYEALGEVITEHVYGLLESDAKLKKINIPLDAKEDEPQGFIFASEDASTNPDKLLVLIHGSGVVRAGQWARSLIINHSLEKGTQLPYIKAAKEKGYGVLVLNTNQNSVIRDGERVDIRGSAGPERHTVYVWDNIISKAKAKHIAIVAHSYGGLVTAELAVHREEEFKKRVFAVALTDSVHSLEHQQVPSSVVAFYKKNARNWVTSSDEVDKEIREFHTRNDCPRVSAGHEKHEFTSWSAFKSVMRYLEEKYNALSHAKPITPTNTNTPPKKTEELLVDLSTDDDVKISNDNQGATSKDETSNKEEL